MDEESDREVEGGLEARGEFLDYSRGGSVKPIADPRRYLMGLCVCIIGATIGGLTLAGSALFVIFSTFARGNPDLGKDLAEEIFMGLTGLVVFFAFSKWGRDAKMAMKDAASKEEAWERIAAERRRSARRRAIEDSGRGG